MADWVPPPRPPPLLTPERVQSLIQQGHLAVDLPAHIQAALSILSTSVSSFFDRPVNDKQSTYPPSHGTESGYYLIPDVKEYITFRHVLPGADAVLNTQVKELWSLVTAYLYRVLCDVSTALDIPHDAWDPLLEETFTIPERQDVDTSLPSLLRLFRYIPNRGVADAHTDNGLLTLCVGTERGLQVLRFPPSPSVSANTPQKSSPRETEWVDAQSPTILIGDALRILSSNRCKAGLHRVVANPKGRSSTVFALRPNVRHDIDLTKFGGFGSVHSKDLYHAIRVKKGNINARLGQGEGGNAG